MPKIAFYFPGQGAQAVGMAGALAATLPAAKALFDRAAAHLGYDLLEVCVNGPAERLNTTAVSQPAIFCASLAALEHLKATDPAAVGACTGAAGLSLGEYTALAFAGALSFDDGLAVVAERGRAMQAAAEATPGGMVSIVGLDVAEVEACPPGSARRRARRCRYSLGRRPSAAAGLRRRRRVVCSAKFSCVLLFVCARRG